MNVPVLTVIQADAPNSEEEDEKERQGCRPAGHDYTWREPDEEEQKEKRKRKQTWENQSVEGGQTADWLKKSWDEEGDGGWKGVERWREKIDNV